MYFLGFWLNFILEFAFNRQLTWTFLFFRRKRERETRIKQGKINMYGPEIEVFQFSFDADVIRLVFGVKKLMKGLERMGWNNCQSKVLILE